MITETTLTYMVTSIGLIAVILMMVLVKQIYSSDKRPPSEE